MTNFAGLSPLPVLAVAIPLVVALLVAASGRWPNVRDAWPIAGAALLLGVVAAMLADAADGVPQATILIEVSPGISAVLVADAAGIMFALLASMLWLASSVYTIGYMRGLGEANQTRFSTAFSLSIAATMGVALAGNLLTFVLFYELLTLVTYPLVVHRQTDESIRAGRKYLAYTLSAGLVLIGATAWVQVLGIDATFAAGGFLGDAGLGNATRWGLFALLAAGVSVKAAVMPLHSWLPSAMVAPTPVSALLHAVAVVKAGVFGMVRVVAFVFGPALLADMGAWVVLAVASGTTMIVASVLALRHDNLKRRLAYSTISHLSYIVLGAAVLGPIALTGVLLHIVGHGLTKITLFFCAGAIHVRTHKENVSEMDGIGWAMPVTMGAFALASLSLAGIPPFVLFVSKAYLAWGAADAGLRVFTVLYLLSGVLSAAYLFPVVVRAFRVGRTVVRPRYAEADLRMVVPLVLTAAGALAWGIEPDLVFRFRELAESAAHAVFPEAGAIVEDETASLVHGLELLTAAGIGVLTAAGIGIWLLRDRLGEHAGLTLGTDWAYRQVRLFVQAPVEAVFTAAQRATSAVTARVVALAGGPNEEWASVVGRPPLGVALAAVLLTFGVVVVIAAARSG
ncbi:MAG: monovalent cation/H+ antiporter subunit D family protein [Chloroflexi bacterium]|nr:monovalent cation/H+ antiporter subunit D family protein [Chloroflexota bacterium]